MVARGWSPSERQRRAFYLGVGLLLAFNPFLVHEFDLGGERYEYAAVGVEPAAAGLDFEDDTRAPYGAAVDGIDCYLLDRPWTCALEERAAASGTVTVTVDHAYAATGDGFIRLEDGFYRRSVTDGDDNTTIEYERVDPATVLATVSVPVERARAPFQRSVRGNETVTSRFEYDRARFVRSGEDYYLVGQVGTNYGIDGRWGLSLVGSVLGLFALRRGHRRLLRTEP